MQTSHDPFMDALTTAVALGRAGDAERAKAQLLALWPTVRSDDPTTAYHRCVLCHYLADLYPDPAESLVWDLRALDAAATAPDDTVVGFTPSLCLNLADAFRRLGAEHVARAYLQEAVSAIDTLPDDDYGSWIRRCIDDVSEALDAGDTAVLMMTPEAYPSAGDGEADLGSDNSEALNSSLQE